MTPEERLADLEDWLLKRYNAALEIWSHAESPAVRATMFCEMQVIAAVARHLLTGRDVGVPLFDERLMPFAQHVDFRKKWEE